MFIPQEELDTRIQKVRALLQTRFPHLSGVFIASRLNIYYLTGTLAQGLLWLPLEGECALFVRKGAERAKIDTSLTHIVTYRSYAEIIPYISEISTLFPTQGEIGLDMRSLSASSLILLERKFTTHTFLSIDSVLRDVRSVKSEYERDKMREAGKRHALVLEEILPYHLQKIIEEKQKKPSLCSHFPKALPYLTKNPQNALLTERDIANLCLQIFLELDHGALMRMGDTEGEIFMGHLACGSSGNYPHYSDVPMGFRGTHPAMLCHGSSFEWKKGMPLAVDMPFNYHGYCTDKTQSYFYGKKDDIPAIALKAYECCLEIQHMIIHNMKVGAIPSELWLHSQAIAKKYNFAENFMGYKTNQVPFLGHSIGLTIAEQPVIAANFNLPLEKGMVLAAEPKIGIPDFGMIGIENTFEVTDTCAVNLSSFNEELIYING